MKTFSNQVDLTAYWEGFRPKAYKCPAGVLTIGYGETHPNGKPVTPDMTCTEHEAMRWLSKRLFNYKITTHMRTNPPVLYPYQRDAIADLSYNMGETAFPTLLKHLKAGDTEKASLEFLNGFYANHEPLIGLLLRRISEYNTFENARYEAYEKGDPIPKDLHDKLLKMNSGNPKGLAMINRLKVLA